MHTGQTTNPYGHFDDAAREYVITRPDTPLPWLNYLGQERFFGLVTNTGGGYSFWRDARLRRLTRYRYNNVPYDSNGRYLYIKDGGTVWNPGWKPVKAPLDRYECRHGLGYTRFTSEKNGVEVEWLLFVPPGEDLEVWQTTVRNRGARAKSLDLFSFVEFCFFEAQNDLNNLQRTLSIGEVEVEGAAIYHKTEFRERRDHYTLFGCTREIAGFDTDREVFLGMHNGLHEARVPFEGKARNSVAHGWSPCGCHHLQLDLASGGEETFAFILAYVQPGEPKFVAPHVINKEKGRALLARYASMTTVDEAFARLGEYWKGNLSVFQCATPDEHLNRMGNTWNQYQCMATFNLSRSASLFETGIGRGMGFRDSNQDTLGFNHMVPTRVRERLLDIAGTQLQDGTCYHQYQPLTKQGNQEMGGGFMDDHLWLVLAVCAYIQETGDRSILDERIGYYDDRDCGATVLDHLELSLEFCRRERGPHQLPLIGHADWNDCLNLNCFSTEPNESFQTAGDVEGSVAESLMIAGLFLHTTDLMARLYDWMDRPRDGDRLRGYRAEMLEAVETHGWDGEWYLRAFDAQSRPVGSKDNAEGRIFIESQGWLVMGGAGLDNGRARQALESVHTHLYTPHGCVLQQPAYSTYQLHLGEVTSYPPGYKENAGIFCHNNPWIMLALQKLGLGDRAFEYYLAICPSRRETMIETYRGEPYVYPQMVAGKDAATPGEAKNGWLTGTAAWNFLVVSQGILGLQPDFDGLRLDPCIPSHWPEFSVTRRYRDTEYRIRVKNPAARNRGIRRMLVDGRTVEGNLLPPKPGAVVEVEAVLEP